MALTQTHRLKRQKEHNNKIFYKVKSATDIYEHIFYSNPSPITFKLSLKDHIQIPMLIAKLNSLYLSFLFSLKKHHRTHNKTSLQDIVTFFMNFMKLTIYLINSSVGGNRYPPEIISSLFPHVRVYDEIKMLFNCGISKIQIAFVHSTAYITLQPCIGIRSDHTML